MTRSILRSSVRRFPPIARRDQAIERLKRRLRLLSNEKAELQRQLDDGHNEYRNAFVERPSFQSRIHAERRLTELAEEAGVRREVIVHGKFHVYDLARSYGIEPPVEFGRWSDPLDIAWDDLPDQVVIKSAFGTNGQGVHPLRRSADGWQIITHKRTKTVEELTTSLVSLVQSGKAGPPFIAEEFLDEDGTGDRLPTDVKVYAFYGEVLMVVLRRPGKFGEPAPSIPFRVIDPEGRDMTEIETGSLLDASLEFPTNLDAIVDAASRLSIGIRAAFSRIDLYGIADRVVFGEVTPRPGGSAWHGAVLDRVLGDAWDRAETRLKLDIAQGLDPEPGFGPAGAGQ